MMGKFLKIISILAALTVLAPSLLARDLKTQTAAFEMQMAKLEAEFRDKVANLGGGYRHALENLQTQFQKKGALDETLQVKAELDRFKAEPDSGVTAKSPLPELLDLQKKYLDAHKRLEAAHRDKQGEVLRIHLKVLTEIQRDLTRQNKLEEAVAVRDLIDELRKTPLGQIASRPKAGVPDAGAKGPPRDFTLYYAFDKAEEEGRVFDKSPNTLHGKTSGNSWIESGKKGGGFDFTGRDSIELPESPAFEPESFTLAVWIKLKFPASYGRIWDKYEHFRRSGYGINVDLFRPAFDLWDKDGKIHRIKTDAALSIGEWNHVAVVFEPGRAAIYINGKLSKEDKDFAKTIRSNKSSVRVGNDEHRPLRGHLDELLFYPRALSEAEIAKVLEETGK